MRKVFVSRRKFRCNVVDIEASGLGSESYPIEVGVVLDNGKEYHSLIQPDAQWQHWTSEAQRLHGLTREQLQTQGVSIRKVCEELNVFCRNETLFTDCWVLDLPWILKLFRHAGMYPTFKCMPIESALNEQQIENWTADKNIMQQALGLNPHRALSDAKIIANTLKKLKSQQTVNSDSMLVPVLGQGRLNNFNYQTLRTNQVA